MQPHQRYVPIDARLLAPAKIFQRQEATKEGLERSIRLRRHSGIGEV